MISYQSSTNFGVPGCGDVAGKMAMTDLHPLHLLPTSGGCGTGN